PSAAAPGVRRRDRGDLAGAGVAAAVLSGTSEPGAGGRRPPGGAGRREARRAAVDQARRRAPGRPQAGDLRVPGRPLVRLRRRPPAAAGAGGRAVRRRPAAGRDAVARPGLPAGLVRVGVRAGGGGAGAQRPSCGAAACKALITFWMCSSSGRPISSAPLKTSSRWTPRAKAFSLRRFLTPATSTSATALLGLMRATATTKPDSSSQA